MGVGARPKTRSGEAAVCVVVGASTRSGESAVCEVVGSSVVIKPCVVIWWWFVMRLAEGWSDSYT